ncbi:MAG: nickel pincer cofactor biosynthesis protein LarC [Nanoarchaeota archaeon]
MKVLYLECLSGVSGDMLLASLLDTGISLNYLKTQLNKLNLDYEIEFSEKKINGITAKAINVKESSKQPLRHYKDILRIIEESSLEPIIKKKAKSIIDILGHAEARVHNTDIEKVHFHEIGAIDTIIDIVGAVVLTEKLNAKIVSSKINLGSGFVNIEHGMLPVPAPASAEIAKGMQVYSTDSQMELATPTGLAIIKGLASEYQGMPTGVLEETGYGAGSKSNNSNPNILRAFILQTKEGEFTEEIHANIDDCTGEVLGYAMQQLFENGALDVYFTPIQMKKQRPGVRLSVICNKKDTSKLVEIIFRQTTTTGVRINETRRLKLKEKTTQINIFNSCVNVKQGYFQNELVNVSPEYEDCKSIAEKKNLPLKKVFEAALKKFSE